MTLQDDYVSSMRYYPYGRAQYHPTSNFEITPSSVGFFDKANGFWHPTGNPEDANSLAAFGLQPVAVSLKKDRHDANLHWTPKLALDTRQKSFAISLDAGGIGYAVNFFTVELELSLLNVQTALAGLPIGPKSSVEWETSSKFGAVLITSSPVVREELCYYYQGREGVVSNIKSLLNGVLEPDIEEHGLFIVTHTHSI